MNTMTSSAAPAAAALLLAAAACGQTAADLQAPVRLEQGGAVIDMVAKTGHAGPLFFDYDGDGRPDLLVSAFRGGIDLYRNVGEPGAPRFAAPVPLQAGGEDIRLHNW